MGIRTAAEVCRSGAPGGQDGQGLSTGTVVLGPSAGRTDRVPHPTPGPCFLCVLEDPLRCWWVSWGTTHISSPVLAFPSLQLLGGRQPVPVHRIPSSPDSP